MRPAMGMSLATGGLGLSARFTLGTGPSVLWAATPFSWVGLQKISCSDLPHLATGSIYMGSRAASLSIHTPGMNKNAVHLTQQASSVLSMHDLLHRCQPYAVMPELAGGAKCEVRPGGG